MSPRSRPKVPRLAALRRLARQGALAFVFALVSAFLLGCAVLAATFLVAPAAATIAGHIAAMFGFPVFLLGALASSLFPAKRR